MVDDIGSTGLKGRVPRAPRAATPWILGLYSLAGATFLMGARWAGWFVGTGSESQFLLVPFAAVLGGITLLAGLWALETSNGLAVGVLGTWGAFWLAYGLLNALFMSGRLAEPTWPFPEMGLWFVVVAAITWVSAIAALSESLALGLALGFLGAGSTVMAIADTVGRGGLLTATGWLFVIAAALAWYTAAGLTFDAVYHERVLPLGSYAQEPPQKRERAGERGPISVETPMNRRIG